MKIDQAIKYIQQHGCICKHVERAIAKLVQVAASTPEASVTFGRKMVVLEANNGREVLCSRFFEQRY